MNMTQQRVLNNEKFLLVSESLFVHNNSCSSIFHEYTIFFHYLIMNIQHIADHVKNMDLTLSVPWFMWSKTFLYFTYDSYHTLFG